MKTNFLKKAALLVSMVLLVSILPTSVFAAESHPGMMTITSGQSVGDGSYINHNNGGYPFIMKFTLDESNIPLQSCKLGIYAFDCDWDRTGSTREYDIVTVNGTSVGRLSGQNQTWNTTYFDVPISLLNIGENTITVYVGHEDNTTHEIVRDTDTWRLTIKWASLQFDGGKSSNAPSTFSIKLNYANRTESGIQCGALVNISASESHSYNVEYSLVDKVAGSPSYGEIVSSDAETVSGSSIQSNGHFYLGGDAPMGIKGFPQLLSELPCGYSPNRPFRKRAASSGHPVTAGSNRAGSEHHVVLSPSDRPCAPCG